MMETLGADRKLDLLFKLAGLDQREFAEALDQAIKDGYVTKTEFERFVHVMREQVEGQNKLTKERADAQDELIKLKIENVELKLQAANQAGLDRYIEDKLPEAMAELHRKQRSNFVNFLRQRAMLIVSIILVFTSLIGWYAAFKNAADVRDLKNVARMAEEIDSALR
jgi:hypothetical protein